MPLYKGLGIGLGTDAHTIVLDLGEAYSKLGFAGEDQPRMVIPTTIETIGGPVTYIFKSDHTSIVGHEVAPDLQRSIQTFFDKVFYKHLQVNPKLQRVIICESLLNPTKIREAVATVLFQHFEVPSIFFAPHHLLACFTIAVNTALVLDCSYRETLVIPVIENTPVLWGWQAAPLGAASIHHSIMDEILDKGKIQLEHNPATPVTQRLSDKVLEDIKVKACFVSEYERAKKIQSAKWSKEPIEEILQQKEMVYPLDGVTRLIIPSSIRENAAEVLFEQDNDQVSVATLVLDSLLNCPIDSRKELARNLLVTGGTSMLPGFRHRLLFELKELVQHEERYNSKLSECEFRVHNPPIHANLVGWLGASIFATLEAFQRKSITKEYFNQHNGKLPDWCATDITPPNEAILPPFKVKPRLSLPSAGTKRIKSESHHTKSES
uniref:actin-related protein 10 n=1 Tax=Ciona intestinalis TaxID=7719 RepID=UPI000180BFDA|nr:actin-related protein 10 [Ciona intestinalis]XP_026693094.1 actin-related protein 10 [Ciona intestinalis]|eukprot:XP_026693093.1 actin-related protein 10 [Ciona intestinalis]